MKPGKLGGFSGAPPQAATPEAKFREVSTLYEKQFMREMLRAMRSTVTESGLIKTNQAERIFREQLDDEYVDKWSDRGGVGFADIIYDQLMDKFGSVMKGQRLGRPRGPLPLDEKSQTSVKFHHNPSNQSLDMTLSRQEPRTAATQIQSPWAGKLLQSMALEDGRKLVQLDHGQGLLGRFVFEGSLNHLKPGDQVEAGDVLGSIRPDSASVYWSLKASSERASPLESSPAAENSPIE